MLLVMALGFGREVLHWWHDGAGPQGVANSRSSDASPDTAAAQVLSFGNQGWSIRRREFAGRQADVPAALLALCRLAIADTAPRGDSADSAEQDVLKRLAAEKPVAEEPGRWRLYEWSEGFPIAVGTRRGSATLRTSLAEPLYRVVIWGMGVPAAANAWTLYVFQAAGEGSGPDHDAAQAPLPPGSHRLAYVGSAEGSITAFSADEDLTASAKKFYDGWFGGHGWVAAVPWQRSPAGWQARFEQASGRPAIAVDIRLGSDPQGKTTGLLMESHK